MSLLNVDRQLTRGKGGVGGGSGGEGRGGRGKRRGRGGFNSREAMKTGYEPMNLKISYKPNFKLPD